MDADLVSVRVGRVAVREAVLGLAFLEDLRELGFFVGFGMAVSCIHGARCGPPTTQSPQFAGYHNILVGLGSSAVSQTQPMLPLPMKSSPICMM